MKTPSDTLFNLIKSLDSQEKRQFKLFSKQSGNQSVYLALFDAIDTLKEYDEKKLCVILKKKGWTNSIQVIKNYLQESLFRFLEYHYFDHSVEIKLQRMLQRAEILSIKGQFSASKKHLEKAEKMAIKNHQFSYLSIVQRWKRKIMFQQFDFKSLEEDKEYLMESHYMDLHRNLLEYQKIHGSVMIFLITSPEDISEKGINEMKGLLKNPFLRQEKLALSPPAKVLYYTILGDIHLLLKDWEKASVFYQHAVNYFEQAGTLPNVRLTVFNNLMIQFCRLRKTEKVLWIKDISKALMESVPQKSRTNNLNNIYLSVLNNYIAFQISIINIKSALTASDELLELVEKSSISGRFVNYYFNRVVIFLLSGHYRKALFCCNKILSTEKTGKRQDIISLTKMLTLLLHFELGNEEMIPALCRSYALYFDKPAHQNKTVNLLLKFFTQILRAGSGGKKIVNVKQDRVKVFMVLKKELKSAYLSKEYIITEFDFISWAESKIENRPFIDIMKEKVLSP